MLANISDNTVTLGGENVAKPLSNRRLVFAEHTISKKETLKFILSHYAYRTFMVVLYVLVSFLAVIDRFTTNHSPRQSFAITHDWGICQKTKLLNSGLEVISSACGGDYFCGSESDVAAHHGQLVKAVGDNWCLKEGPLSVKIFDILSRTSGRVIITTTTLIFLTISHCSWNHLASKKPCRKFLWNVKRDNLWLHKVGGRVIGVCTVIHVWSLLLPAIFDGYKNTLVTLNSFSWPAQISLGTQSIVTSNMTVNWGVDDIWRLFWMSLMFLCLFPLSRAYKVLQRNYTLAMWLHIGLGFGYFFDSWRRRSHPHVWLFNTPFFLWYLCDRIAAMTFYRHSEQEVFLIKLDENYQLLMWKLRPEMLPARQVCDIYKLRSNKRRFEFSHPFTVASNRAGALERPYGVHDPTWEGHKFKILNWNMGSDHVTISKTFDTHSSVTSPTRRDMNSWKQNTTQVFGGSSRSCSSNSIHVEAPFAQTSVEEGWGYGVDTTTSPEDVEIEMSTHKNILTRQKTERYTKIRQDISSSHKDDGIEFDQIAIGERAKRASLVTEVWKRLPSPNSLLLWCFVKNAPRFARRSENR